MPYLMIEYLATSVEDGQVQPMVDTVHRAAIDSGLFDRSHVRTRAVAVHHYRCGEDDRPFIHAQLRIKPGRSASQKKRLSEAVLAALREHAFPSPVCTVEVVEMDEDSYAKYGSR